MDKQNLNAPAGTKWVISLDDDESYGWTATASLWPVSAKKQGWFSGLSRGWQAPLATAQTCQYQKSPQELIDMAKSHALEYYQADLDRQKRDAMFAAYRG